MKETGNYQSIFQPRERFRSDRVTLWTRLAARTTDLMVALFLAAGVVSLIGPLMAVAYVLCGDFLFNGQSLGKRLVGLSVVGLAGDKPVTLKQSILRNLPFGIPFFFAIIPLWGWILAVLLGIPLGLFELYLVWRLPSGLRLGDVMADTQVTVGPSLLRDLKAKKLKSWRDTRTHPPDEPPPSEEKVKKSSTSTKESSPPSDQPPDV